jgi:CAAX prenyl protease-like protein
MSLPHSTLDDQPLKPNPARDDQAYFLPMAVFLVFTWVGGTWPSLYPLTYIAKTVIVAILLIYFWRHYTKISWSHAWLGVAVGILGVVQWVGMEKLILHLWPHYPRMSHDAFVPDHAIASPAARWGFIALRWAGASLVVPVMEELFWRDYLWRTLLAPNDFKLAEVGEWDRKVFLIVALAFGAGVHIEWMTAIVWGLMIGLLLVRTRSLGACIIAHAVTNFLLGAYVLYTHDWNFW